MRCLSSSDFELEQSQLVELYDSELCKWQNTIRCNCAKRRSDGTAAAIASTLIAKSSAADIAADSATDMHKSIHTATSQLEIINSGDNYLLDGYTDPMVQEHGGTAAIQNHHQRLPMYLSLLQLFTWLLRYNYYCL
uniref:Uncharacterized protein n=1 Tax=Syphacia muris TaxID=451379 RepID=A0A0N5AVQ0_9BILA